MNFQVCENLPVGVFVLDESYRIIYCNDILTSSFGGKREDFLAKTISKLIPKNDRRSQDTYHRTLATLDQGSKDLQLNLEINGRKIPTRLRMQRSSSFVFVVIEDMEREHSLSLALAKSQESLAAMVNYLDEGVILLNEDLTVTECNQVAYELLHFLTPVKVFPSREALTGRDIRAYLPEVWTAVVAAVLDIRKRQLVAEFTNVYQQDNRSIELAIHLILGPKERFLGCAMRIKDVTAIVLARQAIEREHQKDQMHARELQLVNKELAQTNAALVNSIQLAQLVQMALLPQDAILEQFLSHHFAYWRPRDMVGGDMLSFQRLDAQRFAFFIYDCTGHGVSAALATMAVQAQIRTVISSAQRAKNRLTPSQLISQLAEGLRHFAQESDAAEQLRRTLEIDLGVCIVDLAEKSLTFSGLNSSLFCMDGDVVVELRGDRSRRRRLIQGGTYSGLIDHEVTLKPERRFYLFSDGLVDQVGGEHGHPFGRARLKNFLSSLDGCPLSQQGPLISAAVTNYQGSHPQVDDITMFAFQVAV